MTDFSQEAKDQIAEQRGTDVRILLWLRARNRQTGAEETIGFWTGDDHQEFSVVGEPRLYFGAGTVFDFPPMRSSIGQTVQKYSFKFALTAAARQALIGFDVRKARIEIHTSWLDLDSGLPLGPPKRRIKGFVVNLRRLREAEGGAAYFELSMETAARDMTKQQPLLRSASALHERNPNDEFRGYSDVAGDWIVPWGKTIVKPAAPKPVVVERDP